MASLFREIQVVRSRDQSCSEGSGEEAESHETPPPPGKFETPDKSSDITLIVEGKKLYVHKSILEYSSPVFRTMLSGNFKESTLSEIPLQDKYQAFVNFLYQVYPDSAKEPIQDDTLEDMLALADKYQVEFLLKRCTDYVKKQASEGKSLTVKQTMMYLYLCHKYTHHLSLWGEFWKLAIRKDYRVVKRNGHFQQLPVERRSALLTLRCEFLESFRDSASSGISNMENSLNQLPSITVHNKGGRRSGYHNLEFCDTCPTDKLKSHLLGMMRKISKYYK